MGIRSFLDILSFFGGGVCGQIPGHSFIIGGSQLPLCARCTGTFLGILLGFLGLAALRRRRASGLPPNEVLASLAIFIVLWGVDGLNSFLALLPNAPHLYHPHNFLRLITGTLNGLALSIIVYPIFNFVLWKKADARRVIRNFRELGYLVIPAALLVGVVQTQASFLLYPVAALSILGVLAMLMLVNTMIVLIVTRRESRAESWHDARWPLLLGLPATLLELGVLGLLHLALTQWLASPILR
ncbi:MAG: DUF2085 domain-containing protein [Chloroflexi bacterium]|nr:DUF2085 domain-containing protein [Chloroflexota bacterium]